jgi:hypothetical protein
VSVDGSNVRKRSSGFRESRDVIDRQPKARTFVGQARLQDFSHIWLLPVGEERIVSRGFRRPNLGDLLGRLFLFNIGNLVPGARSMALPVKIASFIGVLEEWKSQITKTEVSGFSVQVSVFLFLFLTPDTRHLKL